MDVFSDTLEMVISNYENIQMNKSIASAVVLLLTLTACVSSMWPLEVMKDDFDGATIVRQPPVVASRPTLTSDDSPQSLGFEWSSKTPDTVFVTAQYFVIENIEKVEFIADEQRIQGISTASVLTQFEPGSSYSSRRFAMPMTEFRKIASAHIVKMKISSIDTYSVSRFGKDYPNVIVSDRFDPFLVAVDQAISRK